MLLHPMYTTKDEIAMKVKVKKADTNIFFRNVAMLRMYVTSRFQFSSRETSIYSYLPVFDHEILQILLLQKIPMKKFSY